MAITYRRKEKERPYWLLTPEEEEKTCKEYGSCSPESKKISLKSSSVINEDMIQKYIFDNPTVLGLGELTPIRREKVQPSGGRLDILLGDDNNTRYEVEVQLGATDPSHIIRTLEYWDVERKRYPQYDHCAVIVSEDITGRFMNVISLFNGAIPLIALQISAHKVGDDISIEFTKVIDRLTIGSEEEEEYEVTDRAYWESRSTPKMLKQVDQIFAFLGSYTNGFELKYNKFYIGLSKDGIAKNFISFVPKKNFLYIKIKGNLDEDKKTNIENAGIEISYESRWKQYAVRFSNYSDFEKNYELIKPLIKASADAYNIED